MIDESHPARVKCMNSVRDPDDANKWGTWINCGWSGDWEWTSNGQLCPRCCHAGTLASVIEVHTSTKTEKQQFAEVGLNSGTKPWKPSDPVWPPGH